MMLHIPFTNLSQRIVWASDTKGCIFSFSTTVTLINTPAFSDGFAATILGGQIELSGHTFVGPATGSRYKVDGRASMISTGTSGNKTYLPGNAHGLSSNGGVYDVVPAFQATKSGDQSGILASTFTQLTWANTPNNVGNYFSSNAWTPPGGTYRLTAMTQFTAGIVDQQPLWIDITKDGNPIAQVSVPASGTGSASVSVSIIDTANGNNVYATRVRGDGAGNKTVSGSSALTNFSGEMI